MIQKKLKNYYKMCYSLRYGQLIKNNPKYALLRELSKLSGPLCMKWLMLYTEHMQALMKFFT